MKRYEVSIQNNQHAVNIFEYEDASAPQCEISYMQALVK